MESRVFDDPILGSHKIDIINNLHHNYYFAILNCIIRSKTPDGLITGSQGEIIMKVITKE